MLRTLRGPVLALALLLLPSVAWAQTATLTGRVIDSETGSPLPGANVILPSLSIGAATDVNGSYEIENIPAGDYVLRASYIGYEPFEEEVSLAAGEEQTFNISLVPDYAGLEEVVVTGIATSTSKARSAVATSRVDAEALTTQNTYQDVNQLLGGKVAGVNVLPASGNVGGGVRFNVRGGGGLNGQGQPIIYVDGVRVDNAEVAGFAAGGQGVGVLSTLNPEDIASIDVLKGPASTALYGTEGANGVVLITTKRGQLARGGQLQVRYKGAFGQSERVRDYDGDIFTSADDANRIFRTGGIQQHTFSASGGSDLVSFFASVDHRDEQGIIPNNAGERTTFRANFNAYPSEKVTLRASTSYGVNNLQRPDNDNNIFGFLGNTLLLPTSYQFTDSLSVLDLDDRQRINRFIGSLEGTYSPFRNFEIGATIGYDNSGLRQDRTFPQNRSYSGVTNGERNVYIRDNGQFNGSVSARYSYTITEGFRATSIVGGTFFDRELRTFFGTAQNFSTDLVTEIGTGGEIQSVGEDFLNERQGGVYVQQELSYDDTYFFSASLRRDYASAIGLQAPSIFYPQAQLAIRLDQYDFVPASFQLLKLRGGIGQAGNLPGLLDAQALRFNASPSGFGPGATVSSVGTPSLEPERITGIELGLDFELLNRFGFEGTYFRDYSSSSIIDFPPAPSTGFGSNVIPRNVGQVNSQGVELALNLTPYRSRNVNVDLNATYAYQTSEVIDLGGAPPIFDGFDLNVYREGLPRSAYYTPQVIGATFNEAGEYSGVELAEDGERQFLGVPFPEHFGSFSLNAGFYGVNVYALADYALGHSIFNNTLLFAAQFGNYERRTQLAQQLDELEPGTQAYIDAANEYALTDFRYDSNFLEEADFLKLREITVTYDFADIYSRTTGRNDLRTLLVGLSARNVFTTTKYSGPDPEVNFDGSRSLSRGQDFLTLQNPRQLYFTVSVGI